MQALFLLFLGLCALILGSHLLVNSLKSFSIYFKLKPLFLSIVVLGFVSSSPEWFVTITASFKDLSDVALGNVVGSNIINILLVLALTGLFYKCPSDRQIVRFDMPVFNVFTFNFRVIFCKSKDWPTGSFAFAWSFFVFTLCFCFKKERTRSWIPPLVLKIFPFLKP